MTPGPHTYQPDYTAVQVLLGMAALANMPTT